MVLIPAARRSPVLVELIPRTAAITTALVIGMAALTGLAAQLSFPIPGSPVPVTAQTFVILVGAAALGPARALVSQLLYIAAGAAGLPVFAGHAHGFAVVIGSTGGYLLGFLGASLLIGVGSRRGADRSVLRELTVLIAGSALIYVLGAGFLMVRLGLDLSSAFTLGVLPFLIGDAVKVVVASGVLPSAWRFVDRAGR